MRKPWLRVAELDRVLVNLKTGTAIAGVLWQQRRGLLILRNATLYRPDGVTNDLDGDVLIEVDNVDFAQRLAPPTA